MYIIYAGNEFQSIAFAVAVAFTPNAFDGVSSRSNYSFGSYKRPHVLYDHPPTDNHSFVTIIRYGHVHGWRHNI